MTWRVGTVSGWSRAVGFKLSLRAAFGTHVEWEEGKVSKHAVPSGVHQARQFLLGSVEPVRQAQKLRAQGQDMRKLGIGSPMFHKGGQGLVGPAFKQPSDGRPVKLAVDGLLVVQ